MKANTQKKDTWISGLSSIQQNEPLYINTKSS